ncbi:unnamed protein product [Echinostoma caproni]|uniref:Type VI secretion system protein ImpB n=1 Tax=Echinostoma caproni TaxID=27848 RepID=A0A183B1S9_9TREM|nr:unnamed protein product [Echinostoma caproni]
MIMSDSRSQDLFNVGPLLPGELRPADRDLMRMLQTEYFPMEIDALLKAEKPDPNQVPEASGLKRLMQFIHDEVMKVSGELAPTL